MSNLYRKSKIYIFGNLLVKKDSLPLSLLSELKKAFPKVEFQIVDPNENFPPNDEKNLIIIDTVFGIKKSQILDLDDFQLIKKTPVSPHDYDLLMHLLLLKKIKKIKITNKEFLSLHQVFSLIQQQQH